jgi:hypothetical protein
MNVTLAPDLNKQIARELLRAHFYPRPAIAPPCALKGPARLHVLR